MKAFLCVVRRILAVLLALIFALLGAACLIAIRCPTTIRLWSVWP